ncbi:hypothetical protein CEXT_740891 [Caerostris extrusa]|uniref:Uncharacterized protein n=1 Tax=Caerostris extrusa TaxID=172846 RepID=A0AAV4VPJ7_CAEEX|nr:hypothetical protein CEXT_740891 [Caerostris extrusa]
MNVRVTEYPNKEKRSSNFFFVAPPPVVPLKEGVIGILRHFVSIHNGKELPRLNRLSIFPIFTAVEFPSDPLLLILLLYWPSCGF